MSDTIGSSVVSLAVDASGVTAGIAQATQAVKGYEAAAVGAGQKGGAGLTEPLKKTREEAVKLTREQERLISTINNYSTTIGKSRGEVLEYRAAQAGITTQVQAQIAAIRAQEAALKSSGAELNRYGVSAKQQAAALRGVPAQVTDIVTSLQGGQAPLTVLLQQGGQLKDMFGGVVPAAQALGGAVLGLINPFTLAIAAVAALGLAYAQGSSETDAYNKALILSGNIAGTTADQLAAMARNIDSSVGTQHEAAEALAAIAATGEVAGANLERFGEVAVRVQKVIGVSVADTAKQFAELGKEPVKASEKLNESMNYLTLAVYDQIKAAKENGDEQRAADIAQNAYADALAQRTTKIQANLGVFQRAWQALKSDAAEAWDAVLGIGRPQTMGDGLADAQKRLAFIRQNGGNAAPVQQEIADRSRKMLRDIENAAAEGERVQTEKQKIEARKRTDALAQSTRDRAKIREDEIKSYKRDAALLNISVEDQNKQIAAIEAKYKDKKTAAPKEFQDDAGTKYLMQLRETEASLKEQLTQTEKLTASQKELAKFEQQIADIKGKQTLTADQKSLLANQAAIVAQLQKNVAVEDEVKAREKATKELEKQQRQAEEFARQIEGINISIASSADSRSDQQQRALGAFGLGDRAQREVEAQRSIRREYEAYQRQLTKAAAEKNQLGSDAYLEEVEKIKGALDDALASQQAYFDALREKQEDWRNGATSALANFIDQVNNASQRAGQLITNALGGLTTGISDLIMGDKGAGLKKVGENIAKQILDGIVEQQITKPVAQWLEGSLQDPESLVGKLIGGLTSNKETGENWFGFLGLGGSKGAGATATRGASAANPLYVRSADGVLGTSQVGAIGGSSANDSFFGKLAGAAASAFMPGGGYGNSAATLLANSSSGDSLNNLFKFTNNFSGRANGGFVGAGSIHEVTENAPELLTVGNKTLLMMGDRAGNVTPLREARGGDTFHITVPVTGQVDNRTRNQIAGDIALQQRQARRLA